MQRGLKRTVPKTKRKVINCKIISNREIIQDHYVMEMESGFLGGLSLAGQFINIKLAERSTDPLLRIPLGIHRITKKGISLLYKVVGEGTRLLSEKKKGESVSVLGPLGTGFDLSRLKKNTHAIIVSGGHGIAPLYALTEAILKKTKEVTFLLGAASKDHVTCVRDLKKLGVKVRVATDDGSLGKKGFVTCLLPSEIEKSKLETIICACGPKPMLAATASIAKEYGVKAQVSLDEYMACGIGACLGCAIMTKKGYKYVCKDGPVFDAEEIEWEKAKVC